MTKKNKLNICIIVLLLIFAAFSLACIFIPHFAVADDSNKLNDSDGSTTYNVDNHNDLKKSDSNEENGNSKIINNDEFTVNVVNFYKQDFKYSDSITGDASENSRFDINFSNCDWFECDFDRDQHIVKIWGFKDEDPETPLEHNITLTALEGGAKISECDVLDNKVSLTIDVDNIYDANGGVFSDGATTYESTEIVHYEHVFPSDRPKKQNCRFAYWEDEQGNLLSGSSMPDNNKHTFKAHWLDAATINFTSDDQQHLDFTFSVSVWSKQVVLPEIRQQYAVKEINETMFVGSKLSVQENGSLTFMYEDEDSGVYYNTGIKAGAKNKYSIDNWYLNGKKLEAGDTYIVKKNDNLNFKSDYYKTDFVELIFTGNKDEGHDTFYCMQYYKDVPKWEKELKFEALDFDEILVGSKLYLDPKDNKLHIYYPKQSITDNLNTDDNGFYENYSWTVSPSAKDGWVFDKFVFEDGSALQPGIPFTIDSSGFTKITSVYKIPEPKPIPDPSFDPSSDTGKDSTNSQIPQTGDSIGYLILALSSFVVIFYVSYYLRKKLKCNK